MLKEDKDSSSSGEGEIETYDFSPDGKQTEEDKKIVIEKKQEEKEDDFSDDKKEEIKPPEKSDLTEGEKRLHFQALDLIGDILDMENKDRARRYFIDHPELSLKANKSVKYKEEYRRLMEGEKKRVESKEEKDLEEGDYKPSSKKDSKRGKSEDNGEYDLVDEDELVSRVTASVTERGFIAERKTRTEAFAVKNGINIDHFDTLYNTAESIYKAGNGLISFDKCLSGAKEALSGKSSGDKPPTGFSGQSSSEKEEGEEDKETAVKRIMRNHGVEKKTAERYYDNLQKSKEAEGQMGKWIEFG